MQYLIGTGKTDITPNARGKVMMGWADPNHRVRGISTRLHARAIAIMDPAANTKQIMICMDLCFISEALRAEIVKRLALKDHEVMVSATHTHSAPGGYSTYVMYAVTVNGFSAEIFEVYVSGAVQAAREALERAVPGTIHCATAHFPLDQPVAFNRSIRAYNLNPEVIPVKRHERHKAVDREMTLLRFNRADGRPIAVWNWFPVHGTSMHRDRKRIHSDNKGVAANLMEEELAARGVPEFVAVFAQGAAGDVSPNFKRYFGSCEKRGAFRDDEESCQFNAVLQCKLALTAFDLAGESRAFEVNLSSILEFEDFTNASIAPDLVGGRTGLRTGPGEVGLGQIYGTAEGRGAPWIVVQMFAFMIRISQLYNFIVDGLSGKPRHWPWAEHPIQGNKLTVISAGRSEMLETGRIHALVIPGWAHPMIGSLKRWSVRTKLRSRPFTPQILPIQIIRLAHFAIAAVPAEFTTISGKRLRVLLEKELATVGVKRVVVQGYANAFSSYVTTPEEYVRQGYEGNCTQFGRWTLPAYLGFFRELAKKLVQGTQAEALRPVPPESSYLEAIQMTDEEEN